MSNHFQFLSSEAQNASEYSDRLKVEQQKYFYQIANGSLPCLVWQIARLIKQGWLLSEKQISIMDEGFWFLTIFQSSISSQCRVPFFKPSSFDWLMFLMKVRWCMSPCIQLYIYTSIFYLTDSVLSNLKPFPCSSASTHLSCVYFAKLHLFFQKRHFCINKRRRFVEKTTHPHRWKTAPAQTLMLKKYRQSIFLKPYIRSFPSSPCLSFRHIYWLFGSCFCG